MKKKSVKAQEESKSKVKMVESVLQSSYWNKILFLLLELQDFENVLSDGHKVEVLGSSY